MFMTPAAPGGSALSKRDPIPKPSSANGLILESWAQGYMVGSLIIMAAITVANMRRGVLLHKLIMVELIFGTFMGTFIFCDPPVYGWYLSTTAIFLNSSWSLHNVIAWMKSKPFLSKRWSRFYIITVALAQPYWVIEIYANFVYFNYGDPIFLKTRPYEALFRDPWWIFTTINLFWNIATRYNIPFRSLVVISPRFGVLLTAMILSICFIIVDICAVTGAFSSVLPDGLNPFWKLAFIFKCLCDTIVLDDFKTALDRLMRWKMKREGLGVATMTDDPEEGAIWATGCAIDENDDVFCDNRTDRRATKSEIDEEAQIETIEKQQADSFKQGSSQVAATKALPKHIEHYDDIDLPDLESDSSFRHSSGRCRCSL